MGPGIRRYFNTGIVRINGLKAILEQVVKKIINVLCAALYRRECRIKVYINLYVSTLFFSLQDCECTSDAFFNYNCIKLSILIKNFDEPYYIVHHMLETHVLEHKRFICIVQGITCQDT